MELQWQSILREWVWEQHPHRLFAIAPDGTLLAMNLGARQLLGSNSMHLVGGCYRDVRDQRGYHYLGVYPFEQVKQQKQSICLDDKIADHYYHIHYSPLLTPQGELSGIIVALEDFTEITNILRSNEELQGQVYHAAKLASVGELAAGVGHEINNPLAVLSGNGYLFETKYQKNNLSSEDVEKLIRVQKEAIGRIKGIVEGLRTYARMDSDDLQKVDINRVIVDTLNFVQSLYQQEGIQLESNLAPQGLLVCVNRGRMQQVIINLLSNAKDACAKRIVKRILISSEIQGKIAVLKITDNGEGISPENLQRIFNPFFTTKEVGKGTGLGLKIVKNIIEKSGGIINIETELDIGTTIEMRLPLSDSAIASGQ